MRVRRRRRAAKSRTSIRTPKGSSSTRVGGQSSSAMLLYGLPRVRMGTSRRCAWKAVPPLCWQNPMDVFLYTQHAKDATVARLSPSGFYCASGCTHPVPSICEASLSEDTAPRKQARGSVACCVMSAAHRGHAPGCQLRGSRVHAMTVRIFLSQAMLAATSRSGRRTTRTTRSSSKGRSSATPCRTSRWATPARSVHPVPLRTWQGEPSPGADVAVVDAVVPSGCKVGQAYLPTPRNAK